MTDDDAPQDARFEDATERPLRLRALDADDLGIVSALVQDAVFPGSEMHWSARKRRFSVLLNRFRWEDAAAGLRHPPERVRTMLVIGDVLRARTSGVRRDAETILSLLLMDFAPGVDGTGTLTLTLAGDGAIALEVEALDITLTDVTRPYLDPARRAPDHPDEP